MNRAVFCDCAAHFARGGSVTRLEHGDHVELPEHAAHHDEGGRGGAKHDEHSQRVGEEADFQRQADERREDGAGL